MSFLFIYGNLKELFAQVKLSTTFHVTREEVIEIQLLLPLLAIFVYNPRKAVESPFLVQPPKANLETILCTSIYSALIKFIAII